MAWTRDPITRKPLLCLAGHRPTHIRIIDIDSGKPVRTLAGHGKGLNDLAVSPLSSNILASASEDYTIRLWNLDPKHAHQPCVAMFSGEGHKQPILTAKFHPNGRWLLTGGLDTAVCLWPVPSLNELNRKHLSDEELQQHQDPKIIYYPHFHSTEIHHNYVDSLHFYGDLILSKAARDGGDKNKKNEILLWKIEGFDPDSPPPSEPPIPTPDTYTRSSFPHPPRSAGFQRLLSFRIDHTDRFYHRFGLLRSPGMRPILCMGTEQSKFYFWDLQDLEEGKAYVEEKGRRGGKGGRGGRGKKEKTNVSSENLNRLEGLRRAESVASESTATGTGTGTGTGPGKSTRESHHFLLTPLHLPKTPPQQILTSNPTIPAHPSTTSVTPSQPQNQDPDRKHDLSDAFRQLPPQNVQIAGTGWTTFGQGKTKRERHFATSQLDWSPDGRWLLAVGDLGMVCVFYRDGSRV